MEIRPSCGSFKHMQIIEYCGTTSVSPMEPGNLAVSPGWQPQKSSNQRWLQAHFWEVSSRSMNMMPTDWREAEGECKDCF